ncbi:MAG: IPT/TIG domain-containing protein [Bacteroidota bacterium]
MKRTINLGLVCFIVLLLACEKPTGPLPGQSGTSPPDPITIHAMQPSVGNIGDEVVLIVENLPENVIYEGLTQQNWSEYENAPWITARVGDQSAIVLLVEDRAVTIKIPSFLWPGEYQVTLNVGSYAVRAPNEFKIRDPEL